jgi:hypothetical protein
MIDPITELTCKLAEESAGAIKRLVLPSSISAMIAAGVKDQALDVEEQRQGAA